MSASRTCSCRANPTTFLFPRNLDGRVLGARYITSFPMPLKALCLVEVQGGGGTPVEKLACLGSQEVPPDGGSAGSGQMPPFPSITGLLANPDHTPRTTGWVERAEEDRRRLGWGGRVWCCWPALSWPSWTSPDTRWPEYPSLDIFLQAPLYFNINPKIYGFF